VTIVESQVESIHSIYKGPSMINPGEDDSFSGTRNNDDNTVTSNENGM